MRYRYWLLGSALAFALLDPHPAAATIGTLDVTPAATLLIPYFEVDLDAPDGRNTAIAVQAVGAEALLTNVTLWTNAGIPVLSFNIYLTGFDVATFSMRDILNGNLPQSG